jgi:hypothetical protein
MKIRIKGNSIRYRLSMSDMAKFGLDGYLEEVVDFGKSQLTYALQKCPGESLDAAFIDNKIVVFMPYRWAREWIETDRVGFENKGPLYLLIEKDFQCLDNVAEDQSDNYPNPGIAC